MTESFKGYILTADSLDTKNGCELRFYGTGQRGTFLLRYPGHKPVFFIGRECPAELTSGIERRGIDLTDFSGCPLDAVYFKSIDESFLIKKQLQQAGIRMYESDVRPEDRFLMERFINSSLCIEGRPVNRGSIEVFTNPVIRPSDFRPRLSTLSLDIETGTDGSLYSAALHCSAGDSEKGIVLIRGDGWNQDNTQANGMDKGGAGYAVEICPDEKELILKTAETIKAEDPDLIIGWHVAGFDLAFLKKRAESLNLPFRIGRGGRPLRINEKRNGLFSAFAEGRIVIDGPQTLRAAFYSFDDYRLETVAASLLGEGKDISPDADKVAEIERRFREDRAALARYNFGDAQLVTRIFKKTAIIDQLVTRSLITGLQADKVNMSVAAFDHFMLPLVHRKGYAAPDTSDIVSGGHAAGGHVFTSSPGLYPDVAVLDFKSLYPTIIRTFFIDPLSRLKADTAPVKTPAGPVFSSNFHVLPDFLEKLMEKREAAKANGDRHLSQAVKILMNSFYGVMGTTGCRFYHPDLPTAITGTGQWILKTCAAELRSGGWNVLYGDTDSVFVSLKDHQRSDPHTAGAEMADMINRLFIEKLKAGIRGLNRSWR